MIRETGQLSMTKLVAMSGKFTEGQAQSIRHSGYDGFLKKPFQIRQVVDATEAMIALAA